MKFNKEIETIRKKQTEILELSKTMTELNSSIKSFNNRLDHGEESLNSNTDHLKLAR